MKFKVLSLAMTCFLSLTFVMLYPATTGAQERGRFRVTLTGFVVNHETFDDALQRDGTGDEVFALVNSAEIWSSNRIFGALQNRQTLIYGDISSHQTIFFPQLEHRGYRVRAGSAGGGRGGFRTGDSYPPPAGYGITLPGAPADVRARLIPMILWEGELRRDGPQANAAVIIPTIWESDYSSDMLNNVWTRQVNDYLRHFAANGARLITVPAPGAVRTPLVVQRDTVLRFIPQRNDFDRPIGMDGDTFNPLAADPQPATFIPAVMVLTFASAQEAAASTLNSHPGRRGVVEITYRDGRNYGEGSYTIFLLVERLP